MTIKADGAAYLSNIFIDSTKREQFVLNPYRDPEPWHWEERNGEFLLGRDQGDVLWKGRLNGRTLHIDGAMFGIDLERRHP